MRCWAGSSTSGSAHHAEALSIGRGARTQRVRANAGLGRAHRTLNHGPTARQQFERALALYAGLGLPDAETVRRELTLLLVYERT